MTVCTSCGAKLRPRAKFCNGCGKKVAQAKSIPSSSPIKNLCPNCGAELRPGAKFCHGCGTSAKKPSTIRVETKAPKKMKELCKNCGTILPEVSRLCIKCGTDNSKLLDASIKSASEQLEEPSPDNKPDSKITSELEIKEKTTVASIPVDPTLNETFEGLEEIRYYVKDLELDNTRMTAVSSLYSGPIGEIHWKFDSTGIEVTSTSKTSVQRNFNMEFSVDEPINYQYSNPYAGISIKCSDDVVLKRIQTETRIAEKISKIVTPVQVKALVSSGQVNMKIIASLDKKNIKMMLNLLKDLGWFFDITLR
ncbi:MAG: zinc ribbon domain-containing protein [Candidatus Hodarchaeales archaeon]